jgi:hypothetical protein
MPPVTPVETFHALVEALQRRQWSTAADMAEPASLADWSQLQIAALALDAGFESGTLPEGISVISAIPTDSAQVARLVDTNGDMDVSDYSFDGMTLRAVAALPPKELFARYLELTMQMRTGGDSSRLPEVIGEVAEGQDTIHILYRWEGLGWPRQLEDVAVVTLCRSGDRWQFVLASGMGPPLTLLKPDRPGSRT